MLINLFSASNAHSCNPSSLCVVGVIPHGQCRIIGIHRPREASHLRAILRVAAKELLLLLLLVHHHVVRVETQAIIPEAVHGGVLFFKVARVNSAEVEHEEGGRC